MRTDFAQVCQGKILFDIHRNFLDDSLKILPQPLSDDWALLWHAGFTWGLHSEAGFGRSEEISVLGKWRFTSHNYSNLCWRIKLLLSKLCLRFDINGYEISLHSPVISLENGVIIPKRSLWANKGSCWPFISVANSLKHQCLSFTLKKKRSFEILTFSVMKTTLFRATIRLRKTVIADLQY